MSAKNSFFINGTIHCFETMFFDSGCEMVYTIKRHNKDAENIIMVVLL